MSQTQFYHLKGQLMPLYFDLHGGLNTVGRNPTNDVVIHEASVSAFHAEISVGPDGVFVRDLQSTNGTFIDDEPVTEKEIRSGQVVQFGTVALRLLTDEIRIAIPKPAPPPEAAPAPTLPDGAPACSRRPSLPATHRCNRCNKAFNLRSLRTVRVSGGTTTMTYCPDCSGQVSPIPGVKAEATQDVGILARLSQTIQLGFKRPK